MPIEKMWKLTSLGRRTAGSTMPDKRNPILDLMYKSPGRTANDSQLQAASGLGRGALYGRLREYQKAGYITELTGGGS